MEKFEKFGIELHTDKDQGTLSSFFGIDNDRFQVIDQLTAEMKEDGETKSEVIVKVMNAIDPQNINEALAIAYFIGQEHGFHQL